MRKLATAAAVSLALASGGAFGLGLGDIEMRSALNQPMNAEIRLSSIKPGELEGMIVQLASADAFRRAGIERSQALVNLRFSVDSSGPAPVIRVTSDRPVVEPFLNFLLEVDWPAGRMVREYTVLLDPPVFMTPNASARSGAGDAPALSGGDASLVAPAPIERSGDAVADDGFDVELVGDATEVGDDATAGSAASSNGADATGDDGEVVSLEAPAPPATGGNSARAAEAVAPPADVAVVDGDTLYEIARRVAPAGVSVQQMMLALLEANQTAFIDGNINLVRAGSILRVPPPDEARRRQQALAVAEVGRQSDLWRQYRDGLRGAATTRVARADTPSPMPADTGSPAPADGAASDDDERRALSNNARAILEDARREILERDELRIVAADGSTSGAADAGDAADGDPTARAGEIDRRLQLASEELASTRLQTRDLGEQASELGSTAESLDNLVTLRQNEVAALEARLADARRASTDDGPIEAAGNAANDATNDAANDATAAVGEAVADAGRSASDAASAAAGAVAATADASEDAAGDAVGDAADAASGTTTVARNALTDAGRPLDDVQLVGQDDPGDPGSDGRQDEGRGTGSAAAINAADAADAAETEAVGSDVADPDAAGTGAVAGRPWYQALFADPARLAIAGVGGAALLGVAGTLLWRRRRRDGADAAWDEDDVRLVDEANAAEFESHGESKRVTPPVVAADDVALGTVALGGAAAAVARGDGAGRANGAGHDAFDGADVSDGSDGSIAATAGPDAFGPDMTDGDVTGDDLVGENVPGDGTQAFAGGAALSSAAARGGADLERDADDGLDHDDTISEADVYLAYGLHGQAEELLGRAVERDPQNPVYARKLLDTYHAQGNAEAFDRLAADYHERFGGDGAPDWVGVASLGGDLRPGNGLYAAAGAGLGGLAGAESAFDDDFGVDVDVDVVGGATRETNAQSPSGSVGRGFDGDGTDVGGADRDDFDVDETALLDQSLDPAFAFDESDLEATGDFSAIADEVAAESDEGVTEFTDFEDEPAPARAAERAAPADAMDALDAPELSEFGELDPFPSATAANEQLAADASGAPDADPYPDLDAAALDGGRAGGLPLAGGAGRGVADDLTLDLDELSGELELDGTELLDGSVDDLEMADLTADDERLLAGAAGENATDDDFGGMSFGGSGADEMDTMMDLAKAYIDMGDKDSASSALDEIVRNGTPDQVVEAETLLKKIG